MKSGQCVSATSKLSLLKCADLKGVAEADAGTVGSSQISKTLAHSAKNHRLCSLGQELIRDSSGRPVCAA